MDRNGSQSQTVSIAHGPYSEHIPSVHLIITSGRSVLRFVLQNVQAPFCRSIGSSPTNEMQFTDRKNLFTDRIPLLRYERSVPIDTCAIRTVTVRVSWTTVKI